MDSDRPSRPSVQTSASLAAIRQLGASAPSLGKIVAGANSFGATALLTFVGYTYTSIHSEWEEMKATVEEVRRDVDRAPTAEEFAAIRRDLSALEAQVVASDPNITSKIEDLRSRLIVVEGLCCEGPIDPPTRRPRIRRSLEE